MLLLLLSSGLVRIFSREVEALILFLSLDSFKHKEALSYDATQAPLIRITT